MKLPDRCSAQIRGWRLGARTGFSLVEVMVASSILLVVVGGAMTFMNFAGVSVSGITTQNIASGQAANALEWIQNRTRLATSMSINPSGNALTLGIDEDYTKDLDGDGKTYNDQNHFERFVFEGVNSTNVAACSSNRLVYISNVAFNSTQMLVPKKVRNLPLSNIFTKTNGVTAVIRFGIVDDNRRDYYQAVEIQGLAVSLNRYTTNFISILP